MATLAPARFSHKRAAPQVMNFLLSTSLSKHVAPDQRHKAAAQQRARGEAIAAARDQRQLLQFFIADGQDHLPALFIQLRAQDPGQARHSRRHHDAVESRLIGQALAAIADVDFDVVVTEIANAPRPPDQPAG